MGKFVKQDVREWCPSTAEPLLPTMTDSLLDRGRQVSVPKVPQPDWAATSAKNKEGPKLGEYVQLVRMKWDYNKGFNSEQWIGGLHRFLL